MWQKTSPVKPSAPAMPSLPEWHPLQHSLNLKTSFITFLVLLCCPLDHLFIYLFHSSVRNVSGLKIQVWNQEIITPSVQFSSVQSLSCVRLFGALWIEAHQASLSITNSRSSLRLMSIESVMPSSRLILCCPLVLLPPIPPSIRVFSSESTLRMRWPKYWSFSFSISPSKEHPGLISYRMDWLILLAVQGTLRSLLQHHS